MATKYLDYDGLLYLWQKIRSTFVSDVIWDSTNKKLIKKKKTGTNGAEASTDIVTFATVATTGSYNDLTNQPTIPTLVQSDWNQSINTADDYIKNKPTLGTAATKNTISSISSDSNDVPTVTAVKNYVTSTVTGGAAFQGTAPTTFAPTNYKKGWFWVVGTAGTYAGQTCEAGDMIFAIADYSSSYSASDFDVVQTNLDITSISNGEIDTIVAA